MGDAGRDFSSQSVAGTSLRGRPSKLQDNADFKHEKGYKHTVLLLTIHLHDAGHL